MKYALVPGSFDPPTIGHMQIIKAASEAFDRVWVAAMVNPQKKYDFTSDEIVAMLKKATAGYENVTVCYHGGRLVDFLKTHKVNAIVKGLRSGSDLEYEMPMADYNRLNGGVETLYVVSDSSTADISSTLVRERAADGRSPEGLVPDEILEEIINKYKTKNGREL